MMLDLDQRTILKICDDANDVYVQSCDGIKSTKIFDSTSFKNLAGVIRQKYPRLTDANILRFTLREFSEKIRNA